MHVACLTKDYDDPNDISTHYMFQKFAGYAGQGNWTIVASKRPVSLGGDKRQVGSSSRILWVVL